MVKFIPLHLHSHFSLLDGLSKPEQIAKVCSDYGYENCAISDHGSVSGAIDFSTELKKKNVKPIIGCLPAGTPIYTKNGIKPIELININDEVLTHRGRYRKVINTSVRDFYGDMFEIKLSDSDKNTKGFLLTGEHPILIRGYNGNINFIMADKILKGRRNTKRGILEWNSYVCFPRENGNIENIDIRKYLPACFKFNDNNLIQYPLTKYESKTVWNNFPSNILLDHDLARLLGLFCAEGSTPGYKNNNDKPTGQVIFTFNINEEKTLVKDVCNIIEKIFNIRPKIYIRQKKNICEVYLCLLPLAYFLRNTCGVGSYNKKVPEFIFSSQNCIKRSFLSGLLDGDGKNSYKKSNISQQATLRVSSKNLSYGMKRLLSSLGEWSNVYQYENDGHKCFSVAYSPYSKYNRFVSNNDFVFKPISDIIIHQAKCKVYNFEVEEDNSYVSDFVLHNCEFYINRNLATDQSKTNGLRQTDHLVVLAKNLKGWQSLMSAVSRSNDDDVYYYRPRLDYELLKNYVGNLISFSGHPGSILANCLYEGYDGYGQVPKLVPDPVKTASEMALRYQDLFGKGNFFIEIQLIDKDNFTQSVVIADILREVSKKTGIPCVATADSHYPNREDAIDQRVLLCSALRTTFDKVYTALGNDEDVGLAGFFKSNNFHIPTQQEIEAVNTEEEIANTGLIASMCEEYNLTRKPSLPSFKTPNGMSQDDYLKQLCREGWNNILGKYKVITDDNRDIYADRVKMELGVISGANLSGYFLIVQDFIDWARKRGILVGPGRGSAAGCLVSYLVGITRIDPIPNDLLFSRFYNAGRNTADYIEYPDIDCDFPKDYRENVIDYVRTKYGADRVCHMVTFGRMQGRGAIKEVLRVHNACNFDTMNKIAACLPHESEIADKLEENKEDSIINWTLNHDPEALEEYCRKNDDGSLTGEYASYFSQAMRLEGTLKSQGKHASGIIISADKLDDVCPMIRDKKGNEKIAGMDMNGLAAMGQVKFDLLSVTMFNKLMYVNELLSGDLK